MKPALGIGLFAVLGLTAPSAVAQQTPNWTFVTSSSDVDFYIDIANIDRDGDYVEYYEKRIRADGSFSVGSMISDCDADLSIIFRIIFYTSTGRVRESSYSPTNPVAVLPGTIGWALHQTACSVPLAQHSNSYLPNVPEPIGEGTLARNSDSYINVRERPSIDAPVSRQGRPGDEVVIWDSDFVDGYTWYKVAFRGSNATGWVREDLVWFY